MKLNKIVFIPLLGLFFTSCMPNVNSGTKKSENITSNPLPTSIDNTSEGTPSEPGKADSHITGISLKYTQDFFMETKEKLDFSVSFKGGGGDEEKEIEWTSSNPDVLEVIVDKELTRKCQLNALKEGKSTLKAQSLFDRSITASVVITVIDNSYFTYFWQTNSGKKDNTLFNDENGKTKKEGSVNLNGIDWNFNFDTPDKNVGGGQTLTFGSSDNPYGNVTFSTKNTRKIRKISIMCSSSATHEDDGTLYGRTGDVGSSKLTVTIGNYKYIDNKSTPKHSNDQPLDLMSGATFDDGSLSGDITIHFSPTYKEEGGPNSGAIYLKSIIIEYYRGDLKNIEISSASNQQKTFYVGTPFNYDGIEVFAHFSEAPIEDINVTSEIKVNTNNLDENKTFIVAQKQGVEVSYTYRNITKTISYEIEVLKRIIGIKFSGELINTTYLVKEKINYEGISFSLVLEGNQIDDNIYYLDEYEDAEFKAIFDISKLIKEVEEELENGFDIVITHIASNVTGSLSIVKGTLNIKTVESIDVFTPNKEEFNITISDGEKINYDDFIAVINYDDGSIQETTFSKLDKSRYEYMLENVLIADESLENNGLNVKVRHLLNNVVGELKIEPENIEVTSIINIKLDGEIKAKECYVGDEIDYSDISLEITYDNQDTKIISLDEVKDEKYFEAKIENNNVNFVSKDMFTLYYPKYADLVMNSDGFDIYVKHNRSELEHRLHIDKYVLQVNEYVAKEYEKITSIDDLTEGDYLITSIDPNENNKMRIWDGSLSKDEIIKGSNYLTYENNATIVDKLSIDNPAVEKSFFSIKKDDESYSLIHKPSSTYLSISSSGYSFVTKTSTNTKMAISFNENGNIIIGNNNGAIMFNPDSRSNKFGKYTDKDPIQLFRMKSN